VIAEMAFWGLLLTFMYDVLASMGFYLAYSIYYTSVWEAIYWTFIPTIYMPYPPIVHTFSNAIIFALLAPPLVKAIGSYLGMRPQETAKQTKMQN
jgi:hypothetical protein